MEDSIPRGDVVTVEYIVAKDYVTVDRICMNPLDSHVHHNKGIRDNVILFAIADTTYTESGALPVYTKTMPLYSGEDFINYTADYIEQQLNADSYATRTSFRQGMDSIPNDLVTTTDRMEVLGIVYAMNPLDKDGYLVEDARIYGGGTNSRNRSFHEWSHYDGESTDLELYIKAHIPQTVVDNLVTVLSADRVTLISIDLVI